MNNKIFSITPRKKKRTTLLKMILLCLLFFVLVVSYLFYQNWLSGQPSSDRIVEDFDGLEQPIFYENVLQSYSALGSGEGLKLPIEFVKEQIDPNVRVEEETGSVIITTANKVIHFKTDQLTGMINEEPYTLQFPIEVINGSIYFPIYHLLEFYDLKVIESEETGAVLMWKAGDSIQWGKVVSEDKTQSLSIRSEPSIKSPIVQNISIHDKVMLLEEKPSGWYLVQLESGYQGYLGEEHIVLDELEIIPKQMKEEPNVSWSPLGEKINLSWEAVYNNKTDTSAIGEMKGLNVVSPTWFDLLDESGNIENKADAQYVDWAHSQGYQVWALFSNSFDPDKTSAALSNYDTRMSMIKQLVSYAELYNLQGINIDFENVYLKDKDNLTQFVRELTPILHEQDLVVSIDVTIRGGSEMWSLFYDRKALGEIVDYMMVMTYDEHWASSPVAGSVASLPWVEKGIVDIMKEDQVPADKLILGVPFYTRLWIEEEVDGVPSVSSKTLFMETVQGIIKDKKLDVQYLEDVGQNYVEYKEGNTTYKIWIEDVVSMEARADIVKKYDLAGIASWRRGFETPEIWDVIDKTLNKRP
ncbi:glycosyl hydrolase family 18 protein [Chengkuizengella axinellae]|uniref:Glycosyl hydrolase family 18 protein n=1 Tax=Chengkuizengella axinellae TaxID=3064388 RepID=A0ABT9J5U1_9BACL|nr:glycosyl hydrolase family 18 protein [Chengkuizengella sp. 2205SS18-9]MDP5276982.1 glycosyl hydrolase family 18 protein [Chengkuizengella sp. 2205SS18-9]